MTHHSMCNERGRDTRGTLATASTVAQPAKPVTKSFIIPKKLGLHITRSTPDLPALLAAQPGVIKLSNNWEVAQAVPEGTWIIGQTPQTDMNIHRLRNQRLTPYEAAERFIAAQHATYQAYKAITYWEGPGETEWSDLEGMRWFAEFEIERMALMQTRGLKCVIGNFAPGTPDLPLWSAFLPAIEAGLHQAALLGLQESGWPWTWWMTGKYQMLPGEEDVGWSTLRYRQVYRQYLLPKGLRIPLFITECALSPEISGANAIANQEEQNSEMRDYNARQLAWYETELSKDPYVIGMAISSWERFHVDNHKGTGAKLPVTGTAYAPLQRERVSVTKATAATDSEAPTAYVPPRTPYRRTYILLPQISDTVERAEWRMAAAIGSLMNLRTVGHSADDAGVGPDEREIIAINPQAWDADLQAWYDEHYPGAEFAAIETASQWEMAVRLMPPLEEDIALAQTDTRWAEVNFGESPLDSETIGRYGCFLTGLAIILRKHLQRDVTPPLLDKILVAARAAYVLDNIMVWQKAVPLFPIFDQSIKDNVQRTARQLEDMLKEGWEIILRRADGAHFVYLEEVEGDTLHIIDTWDGKRKRKTAADFQGVRAARLRKGNPPQPTFSERVALSSVPPREPYHRTYILLPQVEDPLDLLNWRIAAAIGSADQLYTLGHSADDAGVGPQEREIIAINPQTWGDDLRSWYDQYYPDADYRAIETDSPWEMAVQVLPRLEEDIALAQKDPRWAAYDFGAEPDPLSNQETIGRYGCFLTGFAIILRKIYRRVMTPSLLDKLLVAAGTGYNNDNFMAWETAVPLFPVFDGHLKDNLSRSGRELQRLLEDGWEIILRRADGGHFVYLEHVEGNTLHIIDTWDGKRKAHAPGAYRGLRAAHVKGRK
ncbi:MAG: hypothetical protein JW892_01785 [Anaerolineae bacterium]|nr:hypothetical protein [Anaerolineae bacterium]